MRTWGREKAETSNSYKVGRGHVIHGKVSHKDEHFKLEIFLNWSNITEQLQWWCGNGTDEFRSREAEFRISTYHGQGDHLEIIGAIQLRQKQEQENSADLPWKSNYFALHMIQPLQASTLKISKDAWEKKSLSSLAYNIHPFILRQLLDCLTRETISQRQSMSIILKIYNTRLLVIFSEPSRKWNKWTYFHPKTILSSLESQVNLLGIALKQVQRCNDTVATLPQCL